MDTDKYRKRVRFFQYVVIGVNTLLKRWTAGSAASLDHLRRSDAIIDDVVKETATAVAQIGDGFHTILDRTGRQTALATGLLRSEEYSTAVAADDGESATNAPGLQDFVKRYERQLHRVAAQLEHYSVLAESMVAHQKQVRADAAAMDDTLDELHAMSARIARISLDASVAATNQEFDAKTFVEITDRVRAISEQSHDLTRRARKGLESIRDEVTLATKHTMSAAISARTAANLAATEIQKLNIGMLEMGAKIESTTRDMNLLGGEIQREIHQLIVAMQFQDRIQQKLEKLRRHNLGAVTTSLDSLSHATHALTQRDLYRKVLSYSERSLPAGQLDWTGEQMDNGNGAAAMVAAMDADKEGEPAATADTGTDRRDEAGKAEIF